jgi:hypothetical protein
MLSKNPVFLRSEAFTAPDLQEKSRVESFRRELIVAGSTADPGAGRDRVCRDGSS